MSQQHGRIDPSRPFLIGVLGDFSGRSVGSIASARPISQRSFCEVDRDNIDQRMAQLGIKLPGLLSGPDGDAISLELASLDDFQPDRLYQRHPLFVRLRQLREQLIEPATFAEAAATVRRWGLLPEPEVSEVDREREASEAPAKWPTPAAPTPSGPPPAAGGGLLDDMIQETERQRRESPPEADTEQRTMWREFLGEVVRPHLVDRVDPARDELLACVDALTSHAMRRLLHHPAVKELESTWRGLEFLVRRVPTSPSLKVVMIDLTKAELAQDLGSDSDLRSCEIYQLLVDQTVDTPGATPWAVLAADMTFEPSLEDALLAGALANVAQQAGAPLLAAADASWSSTSPPVAAAWEALRSGAAMKYLGLTLPRFLLRMPYGARSLPTESFDFEELDQPPRQEDYLWGNPAWVCAALLGASFADRGWAMRPGDKQEIDALPLCVYYDQGQAMLQPCTEAPLGQRAAERILDQGFMPLLAMKDRDVARMARWQSVANPPQPLAGPWS